MKIHQSKRFSAPTNLFVYFASFELAGANSAFYLFVNAFGRVGVLVQCVHLIVATDRQNQEQQVFSVVQCWRNNGQTVYWIFCDQRRALNISFDVVADGMHHGK